MDARRSTVDGETSVVDGGETGDPTLYRCALCGARFREGRRPCASCPLHAGCNLVCCPSCGYSFPRSSRLLDWLGRLARRLRGR